MLCCVSTLWLQGEVACRTRQHEICICITANNGTFSPYGPKSCAKRTGAAAAWRAGRGMRASLSDTRAASQAFEIKRALSDRTSLWRVLLPCLWQGSLNLPEACPPTSQRSRRHACSHTIQCLRLQFICIAPMPPSFVRQLLFAAAVFAGQPFSGKGHFRWHAVRHRICATQLMSGHSSHTQKKVRVLTLMKHTS